MLRIAYLNNTLEIIILKSINEVMKTVLIFSSYSTFQTTKLIYVFDDKTAFNSLWMFLEYVKHKLDCDRGPVMYILGVQSRSV